ncbi:MAG: hypothetical protein H0U39_11605 [Segetibacter sp.]|nr:hypothetical protein [Segetibacter sp.]
MIEKRSLIGLSSKEKIQFRLHKTMCDACTAYQKQSKKIDELLDRYIHTSDTNNSGSYQNHQLKQKIINNLS